MRMFVSTLLVCMLPGNAMADGSGSLSHLLDRCDVVVLGQFTSKPVAEQTTRVGTDYTGAVLFRPRHKTGGAHFQPAATDVQ